MWFQDKEKMKEMKVNDKTDHFVIVETRVDGVAVIVVGVYMPCNNGENEKSSGRIE